jgi:RNA polymerase sigma-70 factor (ECF subfamily)
MSVDPNPPEHTLARLLDHTEWLRALARRLVGDPSAADDLVQETWIVALRSPPVVDLPPRQWLAGVLRKLVLMRRRSDGRRAAREWRVARDEALPSTTELVAEVDLQRGLSELVLALEEPIRTTVLLRYQEGHSSAEIARRQRVPAGTVRWRLKRGVDQLRAELDARHGGRSAWLGALTAFGRVPLQGAGGGVTAAGAGYGAALALLALVLAAFLATLPRACRVEGDESSRPDLVLGAVPAAEPPSTPIAALDVAGSATVARGEASPSQRTRRLALVDDVGESIAGASVLALVDGALIAPSVALDGTFTLECWSESVELFVSRAGAFLHWVSLAPPDATASETEKVVVPRGATLAGRVEVDGRAPEGSLSLELDSDQHLFQGRSIPPEVTAEVGNCRRIRATVDDVGRFQFHGLAPGWSGVLWAPPDHRLVGERRGAYGDESLYVPAAREELVLSLTRRSTLQGRVVDPRGRAVPGAEVRVFVPGEAAPRMHRAASDGTFGLEAEGLERGGFVIEVAGGGGPAASHTFSASPAEGRLGDLVAPEGTAAAGRTLAVRVEFEDPVAHAYLAVRIEAGAPLFLPEVARGPRAFAVGPDPACPCWALYVIEPATTLELAGLVVDQALSVTLEDTTGSPLVRRELAMASAGSRHELDLTPGVALRSLEVRLCDTDGELLMGGVVQLAQGPRKGLFRRTGLDGTTLFPGVAHSTRTLDLDVVKRGFVTYRQSGITLPHEDDAVLELVLTRGSDLSIQVMDVQGIAVTDARAVVVTHNSGTRPQAGSAEGAGRFRWTDLPPGPLTVVVTRDGDERRFELATPSAGVVELVLE